MMVEMTEAEKTEEHFEAYQGIITDERVVRKADNSTRLKARELMMRLNVGNLDTRNSTSGATAQPPAITINLAALDPDTTRAFLEALGAQTGWSNHGQPVLDAERDPNAG